MGGGGGGGGGVIEHPVTKLCFNIGYRVYKVLG